MTTRIKSLTGGLRPLFAWRAPAAIAALKQGKLPADEWKTLLLSMQNGGKLKQIEMEDAGVNAWLGRYIDQVSASAIVDVMQEKAPSIRKCELPAALPADEWRNFLLSQQKKDGPLVKAEADATGVTTWLDQYIQKVSSTALVDMMQAAAPSILNCKLPPEMPADKWRTFLAAQVNSGKLDKDEAAASGVTTWLNQYVYKVPAAAVIGQMEALAPSIRNCALPVDLPADEWKTLLANLQKKLDGPLVKAEVDASGINAWLGKQIRSVSREELVEFVQSALPAIKECQLQGTSTVWKGSSHFNRLPGADQYCESLFYFPTFVEDLKDQIEDLDEAISALNFDFDKLGEDPDAPSRLNAQREILLAKKEVGVAPHTHFASRLAQICPDSRADFGHMRFCTFRHEGKRSLFVSEFQSDWAQKGRKYDWTHGYRRAPLVTETEHWTAFMIRRAIQTAMEEGCEQMFWINGGGMKNGGDGQSQDDDGGITEFYRKIVPSLAAKIIKPFGLDLSLVDIKMTNGTTHKVACLPITPAFQEKMNAQPVYSRAEVFLQATYDRPKAEALRSILQSRADQMLGVNGPRVGVVSEIIDAHTQQRAAGELVGRAISVAFNAKDPLAALDHEGLHFAYRYQYTPAQRRTIDEAFGPGGSMRMRIVSKLMHEKQYDAATQAADSGEEAAAHAFAYWRRGQFPLQPEKPQELSIKTLFQSAQRSLESMFQWIRKSSSSPADFAARIAGEVDRIREEHGEPPVEPIVPMDAQRAYENQGYAYAL